LARGIGEKYFAPLMGAAGEKKKAEGVCLVEATLLAHPALVADWAKGGKKIAGRGHCPAPIAG